jgi:hypothetical protein
MTGAERLQALLDRLLEMTDGEIIQRLGDITQRGKVDALLWALLLAAQECRAQLHDEWEPGIEAMLVQAATGWERVLW